MTSQVKGLSMPKPVEAPDNLQPANWTGEQQLFSVHYLELDRGGADAQRTKP